MTDESIKVKPAEVELKPNRKALAEAKTTKPAPKAKAAEPKAEAKPRQVLPKVSGETVRALMAELDLSGKDLAAAGGFSLSRVAELRHIGAFPASWDGRDRRAGTKQWAEVEKKARAAKRKS